MTFDKELALKWLAMLREPDRVQAQSALKTDEGQCCLGVLCEAEGMVEVGGDYQDIAYQRTDKNGRRYGQKFETEPPNSLMQKVGLDKDQTGNDMSHLICMNDTENNNFIEIARWIEDTLKQRGLLA